MKVTVTASKTYDVTVERGSLARAGQLLSPYIGGKRVSVISDDRVFAIYGQTLLHSLKGVCAQIVHFEFPHGERSKNMGTLTDILESFALGGLRRGDLVIALGGGVTGDIAGFAASVYLRGIDYIQIPTTLLAMVDSSVGGKCAVDLHAGKNLAGAFHQPSAVLCDPDTLDTLPRTEYLSGMAEVVKYGVLTGVLPEDDIRKTIFNCVTAKAKLVAEDEFDTGSRQLLNLGHTVGHGIELCSDFSVSHGCAVAMGIGVITRAAETAGLCKHDDAEEIISLLKRYELPYKTDYTEKQLLTAMLRDKKACGNMITLVIPASIGNCILYPLSTDRLEKFIKNGLSYEY